MAAQVVSMESSSAARLAALFAKHGLGCEIEAGPVGVVVYAASKAACASITRSLRETLRTYGVKAVAEVPVFERDEPAETAYVAAVRFDWTKFNGSKGGES